MRTLAGAAIAAASPFAVHAQGIGVDQWTFEGVTFTGGSLTGYATVNAVTHSLLTWSVPVSSPGTPDVVTTNPGGVPLWFAPGMTGLRSGPPPVPATPVPEPSITWLLLAGAGLVVLIARRSYSLPINATAHP